jgi:hypothetical protein
MVHGTALLVRYVLTLKHRIDKYDHLMDIMKRCRHDLELIDNGKKIIVLNGHSLDKRFNQLPGSSDVFSALHCEHELLPVRTEFRGNFEKIRWSQELQKTVGDVHEWLDVFFYSKHKFDMLVLLAQYDELEWNRLKKRNEDDPNSIELYGRNYSDLRAGARFTHMHQNAKYLTEVKEREAAVTDVPLTVEEQSVLNCVKSAPQLHDIIEQEGFEMYTEQY